VDDALGKFFRIFRDIGFAITAEGVIQQCSQPLGITDPIGYLALDGNGLKITRGFLENERRVRAANGHSHERGRGRVVEEREPGSFAHYFATAVLQQIGGGLDFDEFDSDHNVPFSE